MAVIVKNNAFSTLASGINNSVTSITLATGTGGRFPAAGGSDYFYATLIDTSNNLEIIKVTSRSTDVLTVVRGQDGTTARSFSTGDRIEMRVVAALIEDIRDSIAPGDNTVTTAKLVDGSVTFPKFAAAAKATAAEFRNNTVDKVLVGDQVWSAANPVALSWSAGGTTAVDLSTGLNFTLTTASGNSTLGAPTNVKAGQSGFIYITQDAVTPRTLAFASAWVFAGGVDPTLTATAGAKDILFYQVLSGTGPIVFGTLIKNVS